MYVQKWVDMYLLPLLLVDRLLHMDLELLLMSVRLMLLRLTIMSNLTNFWLIH
jgi:hypothetical protein